MGKQTTSYHKLSIKFVVFYVVNILLFYSINISTAQSVNRGACNAGFVIYFGNGVQTTADIARANLGLTRRALGNSFNGEPIVQYKIAQNETNGLEDFYRVLKQKLAENTNFTGYAIGKILLTLIETGTLPGELLHFLSPDFETFIENAYTSLFVDQLRANGTSGGYYDSRVAEQVQQYVADLVAGHKILVVAHSQGNLYANAAYDQLVAARQPLQSFAIASIATPADFAKSGQYVTSNNDLVIAAVRAVFPTLAANVTVLPTFDDLLGHGYAEIYINEQHEAYAPVVAMSRSLLESLQDPPCLLLANHIYWIETPQGDSAIMRANLDGSNVSTLVTGGNRSSFLSGISLLSIDRPSGKMYWMDYPLIERANLDGSNIETIIDINAVFQPPPTTIVVSDERLYWANFSSGKLFRSDLDGSHVETVIQGLGFFGPAYSIAVVGQQFYWSTWYRILRINFDGSEIAAIYDHSVITPASHLALAGGKIYWTQPSNAIFRANFDGSNRELLVQGSGFSGLSADVTIGKVYWSESGRIKRINLDGSNVETVSNRPYLVYDIAIGP